MARGPRWRGGRGGEVASGPRWRGGAPRPCPEPIDAVPERSGRHRRSGSEADGPHHGYHGSIQRLLRRQPDVRVVIVDRALQQLGG